TLFAVPDAKNREFFYGVNFEYDYLMPKFSETRFGMEIRPIIGWRKGDYEFIVNPIVDVGFGSKGEVTFAPAARLARNWGEDFALAVEYYTNLGPIGAFLPFNEQQHNIWGVIDFKVDRFDVEFGVGYGLTNPGSDRWMTKLMVTTNLFDSPAEESKSNGSQKKPMVMKAPAKKAAPSKAVAVIPYDFTGCYAGGYFGDTWYMRLHARAIDPYSASFNDQILDDTVIGNWYGAIAGRAGWAAPRALFYAKVGAGFTGLDSTVVNVCNTAPCGTRLLSASNSSIRAFWIAGGGVEWAWTGNW